MIAIRRTSTAVILGVVLLLSMGWCDDSPPWDKRFPSVIHPRSASPAPDSPLRGGVAPATSRGATAGLVPIP